MRCQFLSAASSLAPCLGEDEHSESSGMGLGTYLAMMTVAGSFPMVGE